VHRAHVNANQVPDAGCPGFRQNQSRVCLTHGSSNTRRDDFPIRFRDGVIAVGPRNSFQFHYDSFADLNAGRRCAAVKDPWRRGTAGYVQRR
jgi:hypothetical protein